MTDQIELLWTCPLCGLDTPSPSSHVEHAHGFTLEQMMDHLERLDQRRLAFERLILGRQEIADGACPLCGRRSDG